MKKWYKARKLRAGARDLRRARERLVKYGWTKHSFGNRHDGYCAAGALDRVMYSPFHCLGAYKQECVVLALAQCLIDELGWEPDRVSQMGFSGSARVEYIYILNDSCMEKENVLNAFQKAADKLDSDADQLLGKKKSVSLPTKESSSKQPLWKVIAASLLFFLPWSS